LTLPKTLSACTFSLAASTVAAQPYSDSMADCASIYQNAAQWVAADDLAIKLKYAANQWHAAAVSQAIAEGRPQTETQMWDKVDRQTEVWEAKGAAFIMSQEFRDWTAYCKSFAAHTKVAFKMP